MYDLSRAYVVCWNEMADQMTTFISVYGGPTPESVNMERSTDIVEQVGMYLFALYHVVIIIVLINMLIAMMSHSFEDIQVNIYFLKYLSVWKNLPIGSTLRWVGGRGHFFFLLNFPSLEKDLWVNAHILKYEEFFFTSCK